MDADTIGRRIAAFRKERGISSTDQLAEIIGGDLVSGAVLRNIESGRKSDLTVSQLLNISRALAVSPLFLLAPLARPFDKVDLPNVSAAVAEMTVSDFDAWISAHPYQAGYMTNRIETMERQELDAFRELVGLARERRRLRAGRAFHDRALGQDAALNEVERFSTHEQRLLAVESSVTDLTAYLAAAGWDTSWVGP
jgi:transcriptional regulator with XRE-family HTH domain